MAGRYLRAVLALLTFFSVATAAAAIAATPLPTPGGRSVYDVADVIGAEHESLMENLHLELLDKTGVAIVVVTVPRLEDETIDGLALRIGEEWGVGTKGEDLGLVVALAVEERQVYVATGYGMEAFLPDGRVGRMIDDYAMPSFRQDDLSQGLYLLSAGLAEASAAGFNTSLSGMPELPQPTAPKELGPREIVMGVLSLLVFGYLLWRHPRLLIFLLLLSRHRGGPGGGGFGGGTGFGGFGGGGFGGGGAGRGF